MDGIATLSQESKNTPRMKTKLLLLSLLLVVSCQRRPLAQPLSQEKLQSVYIALLEESERGRGLVQDSLRHAYADSIFRAFNTTEHEFKSVIAEYRSDPKEWRVFFDAVAKKLEEKQNPKTGEDKIKG